MNVFSLLGHIGLLIHCGKDVESIVQNLIQKKESFPSSAELMALLDDAIDLVASGLLSLPDDVAKQITDALNGVKTQLQPKAS